MELAQHLSKLVGFHYKIKLVADGRYGKPDPLTGQWDGMVGEVIRGVSPSTNLLIRTKYWNFEVNA